MLVYQVGGDLQSTFWSCGHVVSGPRARTDHVGVCQVGGDGGEDKKSDAKCSWCRIMSVKTPLTPSPTTRFNLSAVLAEERNQVVPRSPLSPFFLGGKKPFARGRASSPAARLVPDVLLQGPGCSQFSRHVVTGQRRPLNSPDPNPPKKRHLHAISQGILVPSPSSLNKTRPSTPGSQEQVVPGSSKVDKILDGGDGCTRQLPSVAPSKTKLLELFNGNDIFASREE